MKVPVGFAVLAVIAPITLTRAENVADRKGAILKDRASLEYDPRWIYDDYERDFADPAAPANRCWSC